MASYDEALSQFKGLPGNQSQQITSQIDFAQGVLWNSDCPVAVAALQVIAAKALPNYTAPQPTELTN